jgi:hypothetical protein
LTGALASLAATLVIIGETSPHQSDGLALQLTWESPPGCPDLASERAEIRRRVGDTDRTSPATSLIAQGTIRLDPSGGYTLVLKTIAGDTKGERVLAGQDCRELSEAAALVLALLINPEATIAAQPQPASPVPAPPPPSPVAAPASAQARSGLGLGLGAVLASGVLPGSAAGLAARIFYRRGSWALAFELTGFLPDEQSAPVLPQASASFYRLESALQLCVSTPSDRRLGAGVCLGGVVVRLHGQSAGVSNPGQAAAWWPEASLACSGQIRLTAATRLRLAADLHGLGNRSDFDILGLGSVYRPAAYNVRGILGLDVFF